MRDFVDAILAFIDSASLSDEEFGLITITAQQYTVELYTEILVILDARESLSSEKDRLKAFFEAKGVAVETPASDKSKIYLGGGLCGSSAAAIPAGILGPRGPAGVQGPPGADGEPGTTQFSGLEGSPEDNFALSAALAVKISEGASGKTLADVKIGNVAGGNYTEIEADGTLKSHGDASTWDDCLPSSVNVSTSGSNIPAFTAYSGGLKAYEFVGQTLMKELNLGFQMPHSYKEGSDVTPHLHLRVPNDGTGGTIKFSMEYTWVNVGGASAAPVTISGTLVVGANAGDKGNEIISFGPLSGAGKGISSMLMCRIFRDPNDAADTFQLSTWLKSADVHFEKDTMGSRQILAK